jgi:signal transduction histidine kinase
VRLVLRPRVAAAVLGLLALAEAIARLVVGGADAQNALGVCLLALGGTLPLALLPPAGAALAVAAADVLALAPLRALTVAGAGALLIAAWRLGGRATHPAEQALAVALGLPFVVLALAGPRPVATQDAFLAVVLAVLTPAAALGAITRQARREAAENRAARQVIAETLVEHTARGERARIARELHDVVAHHISMIAVQAETARLTTPALPAAGAQRLLAIGDTARAALTEMRRLLGVLRDTTGSAADAGPELAPQPGLAQFAALLDEARDASGAGTRLILRGAPLTLDPSIELAAYRIVQEALTNTRRHAPGAAVDVELDRTPDCLHLRVRDNGPGPPAADLARGHGLAGMRERAAAVGGELHTGPAAGGGFLVDATLPARIEAS